MLEIRFKVGQKWLSYDQYVRKTGPSCGFYLLGRKTQPNYGHYVQGRKRRSSYGHYVQGMTTMSSYDHLVIMSKVGQQVQVMACKAEQQLTNPSFAKYDRWNDIPKLKRWKRAL